MAIDSPAVQFLTRQIDTREKIRIRFRADAGGFLDAHELIFSALVGSLERFGGRKWPDGLRSEDVAKISQQSQLSALFLQGVDPCEVATAEGLYGQAAALVRQHMEIIGAIDEVWHGTRTPKLTPKISSLPSDLRQHYGGLSEIAHASVPDHLHHLFASAQGDLVGTSLIPQYNRDLALFLYRIELALMRELVIRQDKALTLAYGEGMSGDEREWATLGLAAAAKAAKELA